MKSTEGKIGRVFVLRLEDGDIVPDCIESFAAENSVKTGLVTLTGGLAGGEVVSGPRDPNARPIEPIMVPVDNAHEVVATGVLASNREGKPVLHIHGALGRSGSTLTGCLRPGVKTWLVGEVVLYEIVGATALRCPDDGSGLELLTVGEGACSDETAPVSVQAVSVQTGEGSSEPASRILYRFNAIIN